MFDPLSYGRAAIESHEQNHSWHGDGLDVLIDAGREAIEKLLREDNDSAVALIREWTSSGVPLLMRLAVHAVGKNEAQTSDDKIAWLLEHDYLFASGMKHETFKVLEATYAQASEDTRLRVLDRVDQGLRGEVAERLDDDTRDYVKYNVLVWLNAAAPSDAETQARLNRIQETHPNFAPREHPDFDSWMSTGHVAPTSGVSAEELLSKDPLLQEDFDWILSFHAGVGAKWDSDTWDRSERLSEAAYKNFEWGISLASGLLNRGNLDSGLWSVLIEGWTKATMSVAQWNKTFELLEAHGDLCSHAYAISRLLEEGVRKEEGALPEGQLERALGLGLKILNDCPLAEPEDDTPRRWLDRAINHPGGKLTEFFLHALAGEWRQHQDDWVGLPGVYRDLLARVLERDSFAKRLGAVVLASQFHFLYAADREWAVENVLPLFGWETNIQRAEEAWHGFLVWGRLNSEALVDDMLPFFEQTFLHLSDLPDEYRHQFCLQFAVIAVDSSRDPIQEGWLPRFISTTSVADRASWVGRLEYVLSNRPRETQLEVWDRWLREYWDRRLQGVPLPFAEAELKEMAGLTSELESVFEEAVEKLTTSASVPMGDDFAAYELSKTQVPETYPTPAAKLLLWMLENSQQPFWHMPTVIEVVNRLETAGADPGLLAQIRENLARLGQT